MTPATPITIDTLAEPAPPGVPRRTFLRLMAATASLAAVAGCTGENGERVLPYARTLPDVDPGIPEFYATSMMRDGYAIGLVVRSREGRPVKIEGNPEHPASLGAAGVHEQASILSLYDPHRARGVRRGRDTVGWSAVRDAFGQRDDAGAGLRLLLEPTSSPVRAALIGRLRDRYPRARLYTYAPGATTAPRVGLTAALGQPLLAHADLRRADCIVSIGADFTAEGPAALRQARDFASRRMPATPADALSRLYQAEAVPSPTGSLADHRLMARDGALPLLLLALARALGVAPLPPLDAALPEAHRNWIATAAADLAAHRGRGLVLAAPWLPPAAHALAAIANERLGNVGETLWYTASPLLDGEAGAASLRAFVDDLGGGGVDTAIVLDANPAYGAPPELRLGERLRGLPRSLCLAAYEHETAALCGWRVAAPHYLESWGDGRAYDGTVSLQQPLIEPLFDAHGADELLAVLAGADASDGRTLLATHWRGQAAAPAGSDAAAWWREALRRGFIDGTAAPRVAATATLDRVAPLLDALPSPGRERLEISFRPDAKLHDGRFAGNAWLLELPDPVTKLTWGNAALLSHRTARRLGIADGDVVALGAGTRVVRIPALIVAGQADDCVRLTLGYGRAAEGEPGSGIGVDVSPLRGGDDPWLVRDATLQRTGERRALARTQTHQGLRQRPIVQERTLAAYRDDPDFTAADRGPVDSLFTPPPRQAAEQWGMTIDLSACTGCSACVIACQAENNVPVVGADGVRAGREMHWLRIDRYLVGPAERARAVHQPMLCQHCEKAPCEYVCPVNATVHSDDGLNDMIYNRCVGTRFCSNNCPYKVRRFNWFDYNQARSALETLVLNPEVTVRERGVMEKCTYCVQRLRAAQIAAALADRPLRDGEARTACQETCPTGAIVFGSLRDADSAVARSRENRRRYAVLHELGTQPRTLYLARIRNPNPRLPEVV